MFPDSDLNVLEWKFKLRLVIFAAPEVDWYVSLAHCLGDREYLLTSSCLAFNVSG